MKFCFLLFFYLLSFQASSQNYRFWIYPDIGYTYQKINNWNAGVHLGVADEDTTGYVQNTYVLVLRGEMLKYNDVTYLSPAFGMRGYKYLFGAHHGISYEIDFSYYHALQKTDWLLTPEVGFAHGGLFNFTIGYSINLDPGDLDFYTNLRFSLRLTL